MRVKPEIFPFIKTKYYVCLPFVIQMAIISFYGNSN